ncbi:MAG: transposase [Lewinellaceae bacterium]|nr:transposase [Lewinellaceae bacterium]
MIATNGLADFDNSKQLAKFVGVCATQFESGSSIKKREYRQEWRPQFEACSTWAPARPSASTSLVNCFMNACEARGNATKWPCWRCVIRCSGRSSRWSNQGWNSIMSTI